MGEMIIMATTIYAPHDSHGVTMGVETQPQLADSILGELYRTGVDVVVHQTSDREGTPMDVWAQLDSNGKIRLVVEYI
jgi:hypothetical protein